MKLLSTRNEFRSSGLAMRANEAAQSGTSRTVAMIFIGRPSTRGIDCMMSGRGHSRLLSMATAGASLYSALMTPRMTSISRVRSGSRMLRVCAFAQRLAKTSRILTNSLVELTFAAGFWLRMAASRVDPERGNPARKCSSMRLKQTLSATQRPCTSDLPSWLQCRCTRQCC